MIEVQATIRAIDEVLKDEEDLRQSRTSAVATAHCSYFGIMLVGDDCTAGAVDRSSTPRSWRGRSSRILSAMFFCDGRTSSANCAFGRHERQDSAWAKALVPLTSSSISRTSKALLSAFRQRLLDITTAGTTVRNKVSDRSP